MNEALRAYFDLIPREYPAYVVGGAAIDYDHATDVDMLIIHDCDVIADLALRVPGFEPEPDFQAQYADGFSRMLCGETRALSKPMQILVSDDPVIETTLEAFDVSVHQYAVSRQGVIYRASTATTPYMQPRVTRWISPRATLERYLRLCERYGHQPNASDVRALQQIAQDLGI
jgi:hypothetical protein